MNMAILTKRGVLCSAWKLALPNACIQPTTTTTTTFSKITSANNCFYTSACQRAYQGSQTGGVARDTRNEEKYQIDGRDNIQNMSGVKGFVAADTEGSVKATEMGEKVGEMTREAMDTAWDSTNHTTQKLHDTLVAEADENVVDTTEYRTIEDLSHLNDHAHDYEHRS